MDTLTHDNAPTSFGVFKPVGHVMLGLPTKTLVDTLAETLHGAGWPRDAMQEFAPRETVAELEAMVDGAGPLSGFGYEITMLRRYLELSRTGSRWLLVKVDGTEQAAQVAELARQVGARLAVHYRGLTVEELI
jgi:hypothetical protein